MNRRKFLRNISFATTGLLILPSANRIWKPVYKKGWFLCEAHGETGYSRWAVLDTDIKNALNDFKQHLDKLYQGSGELKQKIHLRARPIKKDASYPCELEESFNDFLKKNCDGTNKLHIITTGKMF